MHVSNADKHSVFIEILACSCFHIIKVSVSRNVTGWQRRALKLQQQKQTEALQAEHRRERELEKERALTARDVSKKSSTRTTPR